MIRDGSDRMVGTFGACARDVTPQTGRHAARVFYAAFSADPGLTRSCSSILSDIELQRAERFAHQNDKALFIQRRAFRRFCGATALGSSQPLAEIRFEETENGRPYLPDTPDLWFSFSSCRLGILGAWSSNNGIGVDIEDQTKELDAVALARRFFSAAEADIVGRLDDTDRLQTFYRFWTLKEAALKSVGEGLPFGLEAFEFEWNSDLRIVNAPAAYGGPARFTASIIDGTQGCAALVIRSLA